MVALRRGDFTKPIYPPFGARSARFGRHRVSDGGGPGRFQREQTGNGGHENVIGTNREHALDIQADPAKIRATARSAAGRPGPAK